MFNQNVLSYVGDLFDSSHLVVPTVMLASMALAILYSSEVGVDGWAMATVCRTELLAKSK